MYLSLIPSLLLSFATTFANSAALPSTDFSPRTLIQIPTASQILSIAPTSSICANAPYPSECRTASQVSSAISASFNYYSLSTVGEQAAVLSTMAFESGEFKYNINYWPGNPGQGTRNMQSAQYNLLYALSVEVIASKVYAITASTSASSLSTTQQNAIRSLLTSNDELDFGSAAWFLATQCSQSVREGVRSGTQAGWEAYVGCIGTSVTSERQGYWESAMTVLSG